MSFAHPLALWLLAATPLPILFHLLGRARPRELVFPGTFLLRQMQAQRRSLRLRYLMLLALRMLAIALAALAFAGPYAPIRLPLLSETRLPFVLLDASAGMNAGDAAAWRQASGFAASFLAANPGAPVRFAPPVPPPVGQGFPDRACWLQGALADAARDAFESGLLPPDQVLAVITDMEASTVLPRRWPPEMPPVRKFVVACAAPPPGVYSAWPDPSEPPAMAPTHLSCRVAPSPKPRVLRLLDGDKPLAAAQVPANAADADVPLGRFSPGVRSLTIDAPPALPYRVAMRVHDRAQIVVAAPGDAMRYLRAAVDPTGAGRPFSLSATAKPDALAVSADQPPSARVSAPALIFAGPHLDAWLSALGFTSLGPATPAAKPLPPERAESLLLAADIPPPLAAFARGFRSVVEHARIFRPVRLSAPKPPWQVVARFSDGSPAFVWSEEAGRQVIVAAFAPLPASADLVSSGAFAATVQALLLTILSPHGSTTTSLNPPPACLAAPTVSADALKAVWGGTTEVVPYRPGLTLPAAPPVTDLVPLLALLLIAALAAEALLSASLSTPSAPGLTPPSPP